jgi:hypothetical protein
MQDSDLEALLNKYRPADPPPSLARLVESPNLPVPQSSNPRTWPWAVAAAALLAVTVGLHAFSLTASTTPADTVLDAQRVQAVADEIGGPGARVIAEYIVSEEQRADAEARQAHVNPPIEDTRLR